MMMAILGIVALLLICAGSVYLLANVATKRGAAEEAAKNAEADNLRMAEYAEMRANIEAKNATVTDDDLNRRLGGV